MRRALVLTDESARHPFLASLPRYVRHARKQSKVVRAMRRLGFGAKELRDFAATYCVCFIVVATFIF